MHRKISTAGSSTATTITTTFAGFRLLMLPGKRINVSAEVLGYSPVSLREICRIIREQAPDPGSPCSCGTRTCDKDVSGFSSASQGTDFSRILFDLPKVYTTRHETTPLKGVSRMWFERIVAEGLSQNTYLVGSGGKAAVIDPRRDCDPCLDSADRHESVITHIFETHRNEDYVSGALELAHRCNAKIYHGSGMDFAYGNTVREGDRFTLGTLELSVLETPGHTEESITLVLTDSEVSHEPYMVFSGDTLFFGDIARTDFFGPERKAEMAEKIYDSITKKILPLGDGVILCPAHGAGSACGSEIADHPFSTLGYEKRTNPFLLIKKDAFVARRTTESPYLPPYFRQMEIVNKNGPVLLNTLPRPQPIPVAAVASMIASGCQIVDIRFPTAFAAGHIPGSLSLWRDGIASFAGWFLDYERPIVLVDDFTCTIDTVLQHFVRMGYDNYSRLACRRVSCMVPGRTAGRGNRGLHGAGSQRTAYPGETVPA